ncbi:MAG: TRAP transporter large permease, partial [Synergistes sp.]|nr:TRAP transporter large permease [Synergistes sp.]
ATGVSTGQLFLGGVLPGLLIGLLMMLYAIWYCDKKHEDKGKIKAKMAEISARGFWRLFAESFWALLCPLIILGGIYSGYFTPTEAATVSVVYAIIIAVFIYRTVPLSGLPRLLASSVKTYGGLAFVLAFATAFGRVLSLTRATKVVETFLISNFHTPVAILTVLVIIFFILGMLMDTGPAIIILAPVLLPPVQLLGVDPVHFGVILVCCLSIGLATPPFGLDLFVAGNLSNEPPMSVAKKAVPFMAAFLIALAMITYIPWFSLALL